MHKVLEQDSLVADSFVVDSFVVDSLAVDSPLVPPPSVHMSFVHPLVKDSLVVNSMDSLPEVALKQNFPVYVEGWNIPSIDSCVRATDFEGRYAWTEGMNASRLGMAADLFPASYYRSDFYTVVLLIGFLLLTRVWRRSYKYLKNQTLQFFFPLRQTKTSSQLEVKPPTPQYPLLLLLLVSVALLGFRWFDDNYYYLYSNVWQPYLLFLLLFLLGGAYVGVCQLLRMVVHNIFFVPAQRQMWNSSYALLVCAEGSLFFLFFLVGYLTKCPTGDLFLAFLAILFLAKMLLLYKVKCIFFGGKYGYFHVLLYLCTLETAPLLVFGKIMLNLLGQSDIVIH